jgi:dTDP-4-amino-4,6-dideoxygalactose transaminase
MSAHALSRIFLSSPHTEAAERKLLLEAFDSNWIAPLGPHVDAFEREFAEAVGAPHALALSSGTAALHLSLLHLGVGPGDDVMVSTLTFAATVNPIRYLGARPVFIDSERESWNMDPALLDSELAKRARAGRLPRAVVPVHLYGQSANLGPILDICARHGVPVVEDAAEALGASYQGRHPGSLGSAGIFSFNGNKIITTSGGGMLVSPDARLIEHSRKLATQARDPAPHYQHSEIGFNYRLSNLLAAVGRGQLRTLSSRVAARRSNFAYYRETLGALPGLSFMPEARWGTSTRWLTVVQLDPTVFGMDREALRLALEQENIEARPVWKPMHLQPVFAEFERVGGSVAEELFAKGLCLPSGSSLRQDELRRVTDAVHAAVGAIASRR